MAMAATGARAVRPNDRIRAGFIGISNRGSQLLDAALPNKDLEVVALCDVSTTPLDKWSAKIPGAEKFSDFMPSIIE